MEQKGQRAAAERIPLLEGPTLETDQDRPETTQEGLHKSDTRTQKPSMITINGDQADLGITRDAYMNIMRQALDKMVGIEDYETAAKIRDLIAYEQIEDPEEKRAYGKRLTEIYGATSPDNRTKPTEN